MGIPVSSAGRVVPGLIENIQPGAGSAKSGGAGEAQFGELLSDMINSVNNIQGEAAQTQEAFLAGEPVELHQMMIKAEEAGVALDLLLEIRNKLMDAYKQVMSMPM